VNTGHDIPNAKDLFDCLNRDSKVRLFFITETNIEQMELRIKCASVVKPIRGTMQIHQLCSESYGSVAYRTLSCFCNRPGRCNCYDVTTVVLAQPAAAPTDISRDYETAESTPKKRTSAGNLYS
jgi:hypothetical protein